MILKKIVILVLLLISGFTFCQNQRGIWLTDVASKALDTKKGIEEVVQQCKEIGFNNIYVVVWNRGYTLYPSQVMQKKFGKLVSPRFAGNDMLKELIKEAHDNGIKVHAWFEFGFSSSYNELDGGHIIRAMPSWAAKDVNGNLVSKNGFQWMNAFNIEVQQFLISLIKEVIENYDIDGIQGDDRLPANPSISGYDPYTISTYKLENNGLEPPQDYKDLNWINWRSQKLNNFMEEIYNMVKNLNPNITITMAPSIYPWSKEEYLQDWPTWVENNWVDYIIPQVYRYNIEDYVKTLDANLAFIPFEKKDRFIPGVLLKVDDYTPTDIFLEKMIEENRKRNIQSEVFFFYEGLKYHDLFFKANYRKIK